MIPGSLATTTIRKTRSLHWHNSNANNIEQSMWLDGSSQHLTRSTSSHSSTEVVMACWFKLTTISTGNIGIMGLGTGTSGSTNAGLWLSGSAMYFYANGNGVVTNQLFRDSGWYHILGSWKLDESIASNKGKLFINGEEVTSFSADPRSSWGTSFASTATQSVGSIFTNTFLDGYIAQAIMLDGQSIQGGDVAVSDFLDTWAFGDNGSQFVPKKNSNIAALASTAGGNSFCVDFADTSAFGNDISSNNNDLSDQGSPTAANQSRNSPSLQYPIINPLTKVGSAASTLSEGNTKATVNDNGGIVISDPLPSTGLWYFEIDATTVSQFYPGIGQQSALGYNSTGAWNNTTAETHVWLVDDASGRFNNNGSLSTYVGSASSTGRYAVAWDGDNRALYFGSISGSTITWVFSGDPTSGASKTGAAPGTWPTTGTDPLYFIVLGGGTSVMKFYFEEDDWTGVTNRPADAVELNTKNFAGPDYQGIDYFDATLYQGNGTGQRVGDFVPFTDAYTVNNSVLFNDDDTAFLQRTPGSTGNRKKFTLSTWFKRANLTGAIQYLFHCQNSSNNNLFTVRFNASDQIEAGGEISGGATDKKVITNRVFKDTSQWYHLVVRVDTANATAANRLRIYINGVEQSLASASYRATTEDWLWNAASELHTIARGQAAGSPSGTSSDFYLAQTVHIDNDTLGPDSFGQLDTSTNRWIPKDVSGLTFGTNGFYLDMETAPGTGNGAGDDVSGNNNDFTESGLTAGDQFIDTPTKNFATLDPTYGYNNTTYTQGNLAVVGANVSAQANKSTYSTAFSKKSGKWWVEFDSILDGGGTTVFYGIIPTKYIRDGSFVAAAKDSGTGYADNLLGSIRAYIVGSTYGNKVYNIAIGTGSGTTNLTSGGIIDNNAGGYTELVPYGIALDMDNKKMWIGNPTISATTWNNETSVSPADNTGGFDLQFDEYSIFISNDIGTSFINFGQYVGSWNGNSVSDYTSTAGGNFTLAPPTGFKAINQDNLDDTASKITAWAWIKNRDSTDDHILVDRVRGVGEVIHSNSTAAETTEPNTVQRFLQRGVQVGNDVQVNTANESYVLWQWLVGDSATTGSTNNSGSIASTVIAADAGHFSIGTYTGTGANATIGHGLTAAPEFVNVKQLNSTASWSALIPALGNSNAIFLNLSNAAQSVGTAYWQNTDPTSSVFSIGTDNAVNGSSSTYLFQCFRSVPGVCKVGSYEGNSIDDGPYISLGFKPRWWLVKETTVSDASHDWFVADSARYTFNGTTTAGGLNGGTLEANDSTAEEAHNTNFGDNPAFDFLSDGIKLRTNSGVINATGRTYVYIAMAEIGGNAAYPPIYGR